MREVPFPVKKLKKKVTFFDEQQRDSQLSAYLEEEKPAPPQPFKKQSTVAGFLSDDTDLYEEAELVLQRYLAQLETVQLAD